MANGDAAVAAGMDVVAGTADVRMGYDEINKSRDYIAANSNAIKKLQAPGYAEVTTSVTGLGDATPFSGHALVLDVGNSTTDAPSWLSLASPKMTLQKGIYSITWGLSTTAGGVVTGRTFLDIVNLTRGLTIRANPMAGEDGFSVTWAAIKLKSATEFSFSILKTTGGLASYAGRVFVTRYMDT